MVRRTECSWREENTDWGLGEGWHLLTCLDALYFHLYGLSHEDAEYVFCKQDEDMSKSYHMRNLITAYLNALTVGDTETVVSV